MGMGFGKDDGYQVVPNVNKGWVCPKCGASVAPNQATCPFCQPKTDEGRMSFRGEQLLNEAM